MTQQLLRHFTQVATVPETITADNPLGIIPDGAIAIEHGHIVWVGEDHAIPAAYRLWPQTDYTGCVATPGLIDSHTHPVFAGNRADEFALRLQGQTYLDIAACGGGILKTVQATRHASLDALTQLSRRRIQTSMQFGVTTLEAKSGYGLTTDSELKSLAVLQQLQVSEPLTLVPTFMGAHDIPVEYQGRTAEYVDLICREMLPAVAEQNIAQHCDVFCESGYFSVAQSRLILETAQHLGLQARIHAEEFTDLEGAMMATEIGALSADHLLHVSPRGVQALANSNTVATLLPGTAFYLRLSQYAPARALWDAGATVALATDFNPGSSMSENLLLTMSIACLQMGLLPHEALRAVTLNAAKALGLAHDRGSLTIGKRADIAIYSIDIVDELLYHYGVNPLAALYIHGKLIIEAHFSR